MTTHELKRLTIPKWVADEVDEMEIEYVFWGGSLEFDRQKNKFRRF